MRKKKKLEYANFQIKNQFKMFSKKFFKNSEFFEFGVICGPPKLDIVKKNIQKSLKNCRN